MERETRLIYFSKKFPDGTIMSFCVDEMLKWHRVMEDNDLDAVYLDMDDDEIDILIRALEYLKKSRDS